MRFVVLAALCVASVAAAPVDIDGWGKVKFGMTPDQVVSALDGRVSRGSSGIMTFTTNIKGDTYLADVHFGGVVVDWVRLKWTGEPKIGGAECVRVLNGLKSDIEAKYGEMSHATSEASRFSPASVVYKKTFASGTYISATATYEVNPELPFCSIWISYQDRDRTEKSTF